MPRFEIINFSLTMFTIAINIYLSYTVENTIYNYYNTTGFELVPTVLMFQSWNIILLLLIIGFLVTSCINNDSLIIVSYILTCIFNCLFHLFLSYKKIEISIIFLCLLISSLILNIWEIIKHTEKFYIINLFVLYLYWVFFNLILEIFILLVPFVDIKYLSIAFMLTLIISKLSMYLPKNKNITYFTCIILISFFLLIVNIAILINNDPNHYSIFGIAIALICLIYESISIHILKNRSIYEYLP